MTIFLNRRVYIYISDRHGIAEFYVIISRNFSGIRNKANMSNYQERRYSNVKHSTMLSLLYALPYTPYHVDKTSMLYAIPPRHQEAAR